MPLFVVLREGESLDDALVSQIRRRVREDCSPRHVPDEIRQIDEVPRTLSGKVSGSPGEANPDGDAFGTGRLPRVVGKPRGARLLRGSRPLRGRNSTRCRLCIGGVLDLAPYWAQIRTAPVGWRLTRQGDCGPGPQTIRVRHASATAGARARARRHQVPDHDWSPDPGLRRRVRRRPRSRWEDRIHCGFAFGRRSSATSANGQPLRARGRLRGVRQALRIADAGDEQLPMRHEVTRCFPTSG